MDACERFELRVERRARTTSMRFWSASTPVPTALAISLYRPHPRVDTNDYSKRNHTTFREKCRQLLPRLRNMNEHLQFSGIISHSLLEPISYFSRDRSCCCSIRSFARSDSSMFVLRRRASCSWCCVIPRAIVVRE
jgi:hypothetical protein